MYCPKNCVIQYKKEFAGTDIVRKAEMKKHGSRLVCEKCGYAVSRGAVIAEKIRV